MSNKISQRNVQGNAYAHNGDVNYSFNYDWRINHEDISDVIIMIESCKENIIFDDDNIPSLEIIDIEEKNRINNLSDQYFKMMIDRYEPTLNQIDSFLTNPLYSQFAIIYRTIALDLNMQVIAFRNQYELFDQVLETLVTAILEKKEDLNRCTHLVRSLLLYMYRNCDLGEIE